MADCKSSMINNIVAAGKSFFKLIKSGKTNQINRQARDLLLAIGKAGKC